MMKNIACCFCIVVLIVILIPPCMNSPWHRSCGNNVNSGNSYHAILTLKKRVDLTPFLKKSGGAHSQSKLLIFLKQFTDSLRALSKVFDKSSTSIRLCYMSHTSTVECMNAAVLLHF